MTVAIGDPADPRLKDYAGLTDVALRRSLEPAEGLFMAESLLVIDRALAAGYQPRSVLTEQRFVPEVTALLAEHGVQPPVYEAPAEMIRGLTGFRMHRGPMAAMHRLSLPAPEAILAGAHRVIVLSALVDHTNVGAAFRSAAALGIDAVLVTSDCADPLYRRSVRVSMGAVFSVPWARTPRWAENLTGFTKAALTPDPGATDIAEFAAGAPDRVALVVGSEGPGLARRDLSLADVAVHIPMSGGVDSLNVAAAVAVATYALRRR